MGIANPAESVVLPLVEYFAITAKISSNLDSPSSILPRTANSPRIAIDFPRETHGNVRYKRKFIR
jgi:hypothetical protein